MKIETKGLNAFYRDFHALREINLKVPERAITAVIGPSGCGKSTLLRCFNRMNERIKGFRLEGNIFLDGIDIMDGGIDIIILRKRVGMVFQRPNPFPLSVFDNIAYGPRIHGLARGERLNEIVEESLRAVDLWDQLKDRLDVLATSLPPEQQQRLCISRLIAVKPEVLLMDEPCSTLDPIATLKIEALMQELKRNYTIVIVTHNMQQAARVSDFTGFMLLGDLVEFGETANIFSNPSDRRTEEYITGRFG